MAELRSIVPQTRRAPFPRPLLLLLLPILSTVLAAGPIRQGEDADPHPPRRPDLTEPIVCLSVRGFRELEPREKAELTKDEKLQVYYEPFNFTIIRQDDGPAYRAHLTQDIRIRRAGRDQPLQERRAIIDYAPEADDPPTSFYMFTTLELKPLPIGSYELDLILRDELAEGKPETVQTVPFRVVSPSPSNEP